MNQNIVKVTLCLVILCGIAMPNIIHIPSDYETIQSGILNSGNGDTIVVAQGIYYENLNLLGKSITLSSEFLLDGNKSHIQNTIIDGSQPQHADTASVVLMVNGESASTKICGLTLTGGSGTIWMDEHGAGTYREGGGILMNGSAAVICHNRIIGNRVTNEEQVISTGGGGIRCGDGNPTISQNLIMGNYGKYGGGIVLNYSGAYIHNNTIVKNESAAAYSAGTGIWCTEDGASPKVFVNNTITENTASGGCGGISLLGTSALLNSNIVWGNTTSSGEQIVTPYAGFYEGEFNLIGSNQSEADPLLGWNSVDELRVIFGSPTVDSGDPSSEANDIDGSRNDQGAIGGPYGEWPEYVIGVNKVSTLVESAYLRPNEDSLFVNAEVVNPDDDSVLVEVSLHPELAIPEIYEPLFEDGTHGDSLAGDGQWGAWLRAPAEEMDFQITSRVSNTNDESLLTQKHALFYTTTGPVKLTGIDIWNDDPTFYPGARMGFSPSFTNLGQMTTISNIHTIAELLTPGELFRNTASYGSIAPSDTAVTEVISALNIPDDAPIGSEVVIAYQIYSQEHAFWTDTLRIVVQAEPVTIDEPNTGIEIPLEMDIQNPYPNPFNPSTTIRYGIPDHTHVNLTIYDVVGREVAWLQNQEQAPGYYQVKWDGVDRSGIRVEAGVYFARLEGGGTVKTVKLLYLR